MIPNIGNIERTIRFILGAVLFAVAFFVPMHSYLQIAVIASGAIAILTAAIRFCPAWAILGLKTSK